MRLRGAILFAVALEQLRCGIEIAETVKKVAMIFRALSVYLRFLSEESPRGGRATSLSSCNVCMHAYLRARELLKQGQASPMKVNNNNARERRANTRHLADLHTRAFIPFADPGRAFINSVLDEPRSERDIGEREASSLLSFASKIYRYLILPG